MKPWQDAIRLAVNEKGKDGQKKLRKLATALVSAGIDGDVTALREIGDRLDGKATQPLEHSGPEGGALVVTWLPPQ